MNKYVVYLKKKRVWIPLAIVVLIILLAVFHKKAPLATTTAPVVRGSITEAVFVTGAVKAEDTVDLAFEKVGRVTSVSAEVGQHVSRGAVLASLSSDAEYAAVVSAKAKLSAEQAHLATLQKGSRPEEVAISQADLTSAQSQLSNSYSDIPASIQSAQNAADNAINTLLDPLFTSGDTSNPKLTFSVSDQQIEISAENGRVAAGKTLAAMQSVAANIPADSDSALAALQKSADSLASIQSFLTTISQAVDKSINIQASTLAAYKTSIGTARSSVTTSVQSLQSLIQSIGSGKIAVQKAQNELTLQQIPATDEDIAVQQSAVDQAQAQIISAQAAYAKDFLYAPVSGTITAKNILPGEIASANQPAISLQSDGQFQIEADVPEADIAAIKVGDTASTTLDAYGSDTVFGATVVSIDPAEKVIEGVATYKVTLDFASPDARIKSGMTANLTIVTATRDNALSIPQRAVIEANGAKTVQVPSADGKTMETRTVTTGIRGENGEIEILSGLKEGENVITYIAS